VFYEGLYITVPSGVFEVAVACSGIRYLIACFAVGSLYAHLSYNQWHKKLVFILFALLFPILANGVRAYLIVLIAYLSDMKYATGVDHLVYGWLFFGLIIYLMFAIGNIWADPVDDASLKNNEAGYGKLSKLRVAVMTASLVIVMGSAIKFYSLNETVAPKSPLQAGAVELVGHRAPTQSNWKITFSHALTTYRGVSSTNTEVFKAQFAHKQSQGKLITSTNSFFNAEHWSPLSGPTAHQYVTSNDDIPYTELLLVSIGGHQRVIRYWYSVNQQHYASRWKTKLAQGFSQLINTTNYAYINAISIEFHHGDERKKSADILLNQWMDSHASALEPILSGQVDSIK